MIWRLSHRFDPAALPLADAHYNRQKPGSPQFVPPGRNLVFIAPGALWVTSWQNYVLHDWPGAWVNTLFRREREDLPKASELIRQAVAATLWFWEPPEQGIITFVNPSKIRRKRDPGRCYLRAGFTLVGKTRVHGHLVFQMLPDEMPEAERPKGSQMTFDEVMR